MKESEIRSLPDIPEGKTVDDLKIPQEAKWLIGFWLNRGVSAPRKSPSSWMRQGIKPGCFWGGRVRDTIARQLNSISHWKIYNTDYSKIRIRKKVTWFIDPPYEVKGTHYRYGSGQINYRDLGDWCRGRKGQVIVCENEGSDWLPFQSLIDHDGKIVKDVKTARKGNRSKEVVWLNG